MKNYQLQHEPIFFTHPSGDVKRPRTLYKGGGGGDGGAAERAAAERERVANGIKAINEVFGIVEATPNTIDREKYTTKVVSKSNIQPVGGHTSMADFAAANSNKTTKVFDQAGYDAAVAAEQARVGGLKNTSQEREKLYKNISNDAIQRAMMDINNERNLAERELNFILARHGLSGGSRDVDAKKELLDTAQQGILRASEIGLSTANDARSNDEKTRVNLINSIQSGLDSGSAIQSAYNGLANNANIAKDNANAIGLKGFFDTLRANQQAAQYNQSYQDVINNQSIKTPYSTVSQSPRGGNGSDQRYRS